MTDTPKCCGKVLGTFGIYICSKSGKFTRDGKHYCGMHDPVRIAEKNAERAAKWKAESEQNRLAHEARKEQVRRAECFPDLLDALQVIASFAVGNGDVCEIIAQRARKAIAKATGEGYE